MTAATSRPKRADQGPWVNPVNERGKVKVPTRSGITQAEFNERAERYLYLKRQGKTFQDDV